MPRLGNLTAKKQGFTLLEMLIVTPVRKNLWLFLRGKSASRNAKCGFTLLELLIVIGILAILAAIIIIVLNPAEFLKRSRDVKRQTDLQSLNHAIVMSLGIDPGIDLGAPSTVYVSLPDDDPGCAYWNLPVISGWTYHCANEADLQKIDGSGWMPINFASLATGAPLSNLPIDPVNASSSGLYYTYNIGGSWKLTAVFESTKFQSLTQADGGIDDDVYEVGTTGIAPTLARGGTPASTPTPTETAWSASAKLAFNRTDYPTGSGPRTVAIGDLNGDGKPDLATANRNADTVSVLMNNGSGTFTSEVDYPTGSGPQSIVLGDLNGDGKPDLAVANRWAYTVSVLMNNGTGTFAAKVDYPVGNGPDSLAIGDLNGDGKPDLATANSNADTVSVLMNNGNGTFAAKVDYSTLSYPQGQNPISVAIGDLNGDGKADLATANYTSIYDIGNVSVLMNDGTGAFPAKVIYSTGPYPRSIVLGDLNGDGKGDLATANFYAGTISVLMNNGNGTFAAKVDYPAESSLPFIAIGDLNGDAKAELVVTCVYGSAVLVLMNNGDGTFVTPLKFPMGSTPDSLAIGDLNGDGKPDLATANGGSNNVSVLIQVPATLTVTKVVVNNNDGTKTVSDFPLFVSGQPVVSGAQKAYNLGTYTVSETVDPGYTATISGDCASDGTITLNLGDVKSCTITNDDIQANTIIIQDPVNNISDVTILTEVTNVDGHALSGTVEVQKGITVTFTKADYADPTDPANQDCITSNVCIIRGDESPIIYNSVKESDIWQNWPNVPSDTEWSFGQCADKDSLTFQNFIDAIEWDPPGIVGQDMCLHLITDDQYWDIKFTSWTSDWPGGGFSYIRSRYETLAGPVAYSNSQLPNSLDISGLATGDYFLKVTTNDSPIHLVTTQYKPFTKTLITETQLIL